MRDFKELEKEHRRTTVTLDMPGQTGHGVLSLGGHETEIRFLSTSPLQVKADENGWFDLHFKSANGARIFVHNALFTREGIPSRDDAEVESAIFPNFIAFGAEHLTATGQVTSISFTATGLIDFFHYEVIEWQSMYRATPAIKKALQKLRKRERKYPREYEFFAPESLYLTHRLPRVMEFRVADRKYSIFVGLHHSSGYTSQNMRAVPHATIEFDQPMTIESALDHAWDWRRFFTQLAMQPLPFESISGRARRRPAGYADLYLPHFEEKPPSRRGMFGFHAGVAPFNQWKDRRRLAAAMKGWLEKQPERRVFRACLEQVIRESQEYSSADHVLKLAAGIDGLSELDSASSYSKKDVKTLVQGALSAAQEAQIEIDESRVQGLLGMLRKQNLSRRLQSLAKTVAPLLTEDPEIVFRAVQAIRNATAHGSSGIEASMPKVSPATYALAAICAIWDQQTSGMPIAALERKINPVTIATHAIRELKHLESK